MLPAPHSAERFARRPLLAAALALALALALPGVGRAASGRIDGREAAVLERINAVRSAHGLAPLTRHRKLSRAADHHALRMARAGVLAHRVWGEAGLSDRLRSAVGAARAGEVVYWGRGRGGLRSAAVVRAWMDSPGHRAVLLSDRFARAGIGIRSGGGGIYVTVDIAAR